MVERVRIYTTEIQDLLTTKEDIEAAVKSGTSPAAYEVPKGISEESITSFCTGCDLFQGDGVPCPRVGINDQARYVARKWCGYARVNGERTIKKG